MKLIVAGSRHFILGPDYIDLMLKFHALSDKVTEIVSGNAEGTDWAGEQYSIEYMDKDAKTFPADWTAGHIAGPMRNKKMAEYADALLLIWDGKSPGSMDMKTQMLRLKKPIYEVIIKDPSGVE
jgi:hypothetical protein